MYGPYARDFFKELHNAGFDRKDKHDSADAFLLGVVTILGSVGIYYLKLLPGCVEKRPTTAFAVFSIWFMAAGAVFAVSFLAGVYFVIRSVWPRRIAYLADPDELRDYLNGLQAFYGIENTDPAAISDATDRELMRVAGGYYQRCSSLNRYQNGVKSTWQVRAKVALIIAVGAMIANAPPTYVLQVAQDKPQAVRLSEPVHIAK